MTRKQIEEGNALIVEFLDLENNIARNYINLQYNTNWNWLMRAWTEYYRKIHIPLMKDNKHLHYNNKLVKRMKNAMVYGHLDGAYEILIEAIKFYNSLFKND